MGWLSSIVSEESDPDPQKMRVSAFCAEEPHAT